MTRIRNEIPVCETITPQFISHYLPGFVSMNLQEPFKESFCGRTISTFLKKYINNFTILINRSPELMLLIIYPDENLINEKCIAISPVLFLQSIGKFRAKSIAPQSDRFVGNIYSTLS